MIIGCEIPEKSATQSVTARFDRAVTGQRYGSWLDRAAAQFLAALAFRAPAGYQDETGFHCGAPGLVNGASGADISDNQFS
jgi:hypothetical protein